MENIHHNGELLKRYLLGWLEEEERERLEKELLADDDYFEELLCAEDELADSYLSGGLTERERERFEQYSLACSEGRKRVNFAEALHRYVRETGSAEERLTATANTRRPAFWKRFVPASLTQRPLAAFAVAAALVVIGLSASWVIVKNGWVRNGSGPLVGSVILSIPLTPGATRDSGEIRRVVVTAGVSAVQLELELARDDFQTYRAIVETDEGREILTANQLKAEVAGNRRVVIVTLHAGLLARGDYHVKLSGSAPDGKSEEVGKYYFRVIPSAF